jgi:hypothetical protein
MANPYRISAGSPASISTTPPIWQELERAARTLPAEELPDFLGGLEKIRVLAFARLVAPAPTLRTDELVGIEEASRRLNISRSYLYRHWGELPFASHIGRKLVFSSLGIDRYITARH